MALTDNHRAAKWLKIVEVHSFHCTCSCEAFARDQHVDYPPERGNEKRGKYLSRAPLINRKISNIIKNWIIG